MTRIHERITTTSTPADDRYLTVVANLHPTERLPRKRSPQRFSMVLAGTSVAAMAILLVTLTIRQAPESEPALPPADAPTATLPSPRSENERFCTEHVDAITNALERWRGVENWAWARGTPDVSKLVREALQFAANLDDPVLESQATRALDRLTTDLADLDPSLSDRDAVAPTVAAVESALDSLSAIAGGLAYPCDTEPLTTARDAG
jgi:hypothetical protein